MSLRCCTPTAYDGASRTVVHGPLCDRVEEPLTPAEMAEWRSHPVANKGSHLRVVEPMPYGTYRWPRRRARSERWFIGMDDKAVD